MSRTPNHGAATLQTAVEEIRILERKIATIEKEQAEQNVDSDDESLIESQPLRQALWDSKVPDNFKSPHLLTFDGKTDPLEHLMVVGTQTAIIGAPEHLGCKLLSGTFKDAALRWYMNLPKNSIERYVDFHKKFIHQFSGTKHIKVIATSLFTIRQNYAKALREYLARFSEATIKVSNPNQDMFVASFHNGLKAGHFNESLAQKPTASMQEVIKRASCYIKGEESNAEKRSRDAKEKDMRSNNGKGQSSQPQRNWQNNDTQKQGYRSKPYYPPNGSGGMNYPQHRRFSTFASPGMNNTVMGLDTEVWCAYHRCKCHDTERCFRLRDLIEDLFRSGHLRKFLEDSAKGQLALPKQMPYPPKGEGDGGSKGEKHKVAVNTISGGFVGTGVSNYVRRSRFEICSVGNSTFPRTPEISFNAEDGRDVTPHDDDPLLNPYYNTQVGFAGKQVEVMGHITLYTTFGEGEDAKTIKVRYLVVKTPFTSYNIIIGRPAFNVLGVVMSTLYLAIKYPLNNGKIGVVKGDQALARKCFESSLKIRHKPMKPSSPLESGERANGINMVSITDMDPREEFQDMRVSPIEDLEQVQIGEQSHQTTNIRTSLQPAKKERIITILRNNRDLFAWQPSHMPGIDESMIMHKLSISSTTKPVVQRKRKVGEERRAAIIEEVAKLKEVEFIEEIKYPTWLANVVMVKNTNGKWRMCVDFTDLNKSCPKVPYPLSNINRLIEGASGVFAEQIGKNLEVYIDDMVVKTEEEGEHDKDLVDILKSVRKYNMRLNPAKCSFGVQAGKFLGFLPTHRGIEANPDKCQVIINMRSPASVKEVQQLTGRITALSRFLSCAGEKACRFIATLRKSERFTCEEAFQKLKLFLASPPILTRPEQGKTLYLYLAVSERALSSALVQEVEREEKSINFVSRTWRGAETRYHKIERLSLVVVITARKLRQYFQSHQVVAEYEALIAGMKLAKEMEVHELKAQSDSQPHFATFELTYVPRDQNSREDLLAKLACTKKPSNHHTFIQETLKSQSINELAVGMMVEEEDWRSPIIRYLQRDVLPRKYDEAIKIRKMVAWYTMVGDKLYKRGFSTPTLLCVSDMKANRILNEIQEGSCGSHTGSRSLAGKVMRAGFYWPNLHDDAARHVRTCPFPTSSAQAKWIIVAVDYLTKCVEAESLSSISADQRKGNPKHFHLCGTPSSQLASRISKQCHPQSSEEKNQLQTRELGGAPRWNIIVISYNTTIFNRGTALHNGLWHRRYDPSGDTTSKLEKRYFDIVGEQRRIRGKLGPAPRIKGKGLLQGVLHQTKGGEEIQHQGHSKEIQRWRSGIEETHGQRQGRKDGSKLGRTLQNS
ncbi:hypothetical protein TSUD_371170 [Trifolium subterraneum]|uniref:Reverse transcriptase domain-containing protein n=1 Tax=Trifolium subterraneum TaxID=3900 RepID=A0A2Z6NGZ5_TRISU|nr:hypothetical protein TSUD_371170 [Trifolium subterraneum]